MPRRSSYRVSPLGDIALLRRELNDILKDLGTRLTAMENVVAAGQRLQPGFVPTPSASQVVLQRQPQIVQGGTTFLETLDFVPDGDNRTLPSLAYELSFPLIGKFTAGQEVALHEFVRTVDFPANFTGDGTTTVTSGAKLAVGPTNSMTLLLKQNGATIGTIVFAPAATVGVLTTTGGVDIIFVPGDILSLLAPTPADPTASDLTVNITGTRSNP